ncbi:TetR family transcriptional regulator [Stackebrandtia endophytica]|uniref:TetR family transcriptional regulator n=1 Tax=Stackebrandtia endophytica TaxID=1496996 RepID=A0A543ARS1_9ACTN|nr:TetR family transcriptional regulator [Stackebrandtia endophytica]
MARDEFAEFGYAGARVGRIAERAGVNKQLISYYFGGKEGLYQQMQRERWREESESTTLDVPIDQMMRWYLESALKDPRSVRLSLWRGLADDAPSVDGDSDIEVEQDRLRQRQERGELAADLDIAALQMAWMGMVTAPIAMPRVAEKLFGVSTDDPEFARRYGDTLSRILQRLAPSARPQPKASDDS